MNTIEPKRFTLDEIVPEVNRYFRVSDDQSMISKPTLYRYTKYGWVTNYGTPKKILVELPDVIEVMMGRKRKKA